MSLKDLVNIIPENYVLKIADAKPELVNWKKICKEFKLSEDFIERHKDKVDWHYIFTYQDLSRKFKEKWRKFLNR